MCDRRARWIKGHKTGIWGIVLFFCILGGIDFHKVVWMKEGILYSNDTPCGWPLQLKEFVSIHETLSVQKVIEVNECYLRQGLDCVFPSMYGQKLFIYSTKDPDGRIVHIHGTRDTTYDKFVKAKIWNSFKREFQIMEVPLLAIHKQGTLTRTVATCTFLGSKHLHLA